MYLMVVGVNHKTAPLAVREQVAFLPHVCQSAMLDIIAETKTHEAVIISTCNRTEFYLWTNNTETEFCQWLHQYRQLNDGFLTEYLYAHHGEQAITHILNVACGLDSMILGEPQILGQLKTAYHAAVDVGSVGQELNRLFQYVFGVSKHIRATTEIGKRPISVASTAINLAKKVVGSLAQARVLLIGSGDTITTTARYLDDENIAQMFIANRSLENAQTLANAHHATAVSINDIPLYVGQADIIITATACPYPILTRDMVSAVVEQRGRQPLFMVDLAVPRDIEASVASLEAIHLYCIDDLQDMIQENLNERLASAKIASGIIAERSENYLQWLRSLDAVATIRAYRQRIEDLRDREVENAMHALELGESSEKVLRKLAHNLTNKFMHVPTTKLRQAKQLDKMDLLDAASHLFDLDRTTH